MMLFLALLGSSFAQDEVCSTIYTESELDLALEDVNRLVAKSELDRAQGLLGKIYNLIKCSEKRLPPERVAEFAAAYTKISFFNQEIEDTNRWGRLVALANPEHDWGEIGPDHPMRRMLGRNDPPTSVVQDGEGYTVDKGTAVFVNGRLALTPVAYDDTPHLVQLFDKKGALINGHWQDGRAFRDGLVGEAGPLKPPKFNPDAAPPAPSGPKGPSPLFKPLPLAGAGLVVTSGVLYGLAGLSHRAFRCDPSERDDCVDQAEDLTKLRTRTNLLVLGAGVTFAAGAGLVVTGMFVEDGAGVRLGGRF